MCLCYHPAQMPNFKKIERAEVIIQDGRELFLKKCSKCGGDFHGECEMTFDEFRQSLTATEPPAGLTHALAGLWRDVKGDWKRAHESAQQDDSIEGAWVQPPFVARSKNLTASTAVSC